MPMRVAFDVHADRQACDVTSGNLDMNGKRRRLATIALRADTACIDLVLNSVFQISNMRQATRLSDRTQERLLGKHGRPFKRAADANADDHRWARIRACQHGGLDNKIYDSRYSVCRRKHFEAAHVFTTATL